MALSLTAKIVRLHEHLEAAELKHAFGGAIALAYCTLEPRTTQDIDVNVFVKPEHFEQVLAALPTGVVCDERSRSQLRRDGQTRMWWAGTPVDVFLSNHPFHDRAEANRRRVPFGGVDELPVLACADLAVFKAFFARSRDAVDVGAMIEAQSIDPERLRADVAQLLGDDDDHVAFVDQAIVIASEQGWG